MPPKIPIRILGIGPNKERFLDQGIEHFVRMLRSYCTVQCIWVKSQKGWTQADEGKELLKRIQRDDFVVVLDGSGKHVDSMGFAKLVSRWREQAKQLCFLIGGALGHSEQVQRAGRLCLSLSNQTYSHLLVRLMLLEQLYRAFTILTGHPYPK